ncbi:MAG TPA: plasmid pRiA4b ORF-3 family protein [Mycobacteriales bacterium]|nr:plasmid pRiA4b ORF-3 family protein [Mycobacteriales bacterium]
MAKTRRTKRNSGAALTVIDAGTRPGAGELAELREMLTIAGAPAEVLTMLASVESVDEVVPRLVEAGVLPSPEESLADLLEGFRPLLDRSCDQLTAELSGSEFLGLMRQAAPDVAELPAILTGLVEQAEDVGGPVALAMLRVLAVLAPGDVRGMAADAADRLVAAGGLTDRPWVRGLGTPGVGPCFGYTDDIGAQEVLVVTFSYGRESHGLAVLIDHGLGGGVKDCYPADRPDRIRAEYRQIAARHGLDFRDYEPGEARAVLARALDRPPCPVAPDQLEDVGYYLDLLRQRVTLLPDGWQGTAGTAATRVASGKVTTARRSPARAATSRTVHKMKITLRGSKPPIWRRLEVPSGITLLQLHEVIQEAFGWDGHHMWVFSTPTGEFGVTDRELGHRSAAATKLDDVASRAGDRIRYTYDFGDDWEHDITVEAVLSAEPGLAYPRCTGGRRACPPEDCGGIWGYAHLLEILADPSHEEHAEQLEWLGLESADDFDPADFHVDDATKALSGMARPLVKG